MEKIIHNQISELEIAERLLDEKFDETFEYLECLEYHYKEELEE